MFHSDISLLIGSHSIDLTFERFAILLGIVEWKIGIILKNGVGSILRYYRSFFAWKRLDACRNVKRNENFMYQNTFITKITE
jgi:hypothetical protein